MSAPRAFLADMKIDEVEIREGFSEIFAVVIPVVERRVVESAFGDLHDAGLLNTDKTILRTLTSASDLALAGDRVSALGHEFVKFCRSPSSS